MNFTIAKLRHEQYRNTAILPERGAIAARDQG
jgi:hypothetical protein